MRYKEFKKAIENWRRKYSYAAEVEFGDFHTFVKVGVDEVLYTIAHISNIYIFVLETKWDYAAKIEYQARAELFDILVCLAKTPPIDRKDEKRFIIPLPGLVTSDNKQQYLTNANDTFFASRRNSKVRQTWKEEHLKFVPEIYRQFAIEFYEDREY